MTHSNLCQIVQVQRIESPSRATGWQLPSRLRPEMHVYRTSILLRARIAPTADLVRWQPLVHGHRLETCVSHRRNAQPTSATLQPHCYTRYKWTNEPGPVVWYLLAHSTKDDVIWTGGTSVMGRFTPSVFEFSDLINSLARAHSSQTRRECARGKYALKRIG